MSADHNYRGQRLYMAMAHAAHDTDCIGATRWPMFSGCHRRQAARRALVG